MPQAIELITKSEYARRRGCSEAAVRRAIKDGRITLINDRIDPVAADAQWERNSRPRLGSRPALEPLHRDEADAVVRASRDGDEYWSSKARREAAEAEIAELKLQELRGDLMRREVVERIVGQQAARTRESVLQIKGRLAPLLAAETDVVKIATMLDAELRAALSGGAA